MPSNELKDARSKNLFSSPIFLANILFFCIFIVTILVTFHNHALMFNAFTFCSYYFLLALTVTWAWSLVNLYQYKKSSVLDFLKRHWRGILASFVLASVVFISVPKHFRVLSDETNLLSVAKSMTFYKNVENITEGRWYYEMFWATPTTGVEKRPFLFPFFTSLTHNLLGYHVENVFILNYFSLWMMLFFIYIIIQSSLGDLFALCGLILVITQPIVALSATSGSFEIFNFLFILASFLALKCFLNDPDHKTFIALVLTLLMLANVRYESVLFLTIIVLILAITRYVKLKFFTQSFAYGLSFFLLLPLIWQRILLASESDSNLAGGSWIHAFQFQHSHHNIIQFIRYILEPSGQLGYAGVINGAGILSFLILAIFLSFKENVSFKETDLVQLLCLVSSLFVLFTIVLLYQGGIDDHPMNGRLYIPLLIPLSVAPLYLLSNIFKDQKRLARGTLLCSLALFIFYHPVAVEDRLSNTLMISREYKFVDAFLKKNADKNTLVIYGRPGQLIVSNYGAISYSTANAEVDTILQQFQNHLYSKIYVIQSITYNNNSPMSDNVVDPRYQLETVDELQVAGFYYFRISRVKAT